MLHQLCCVDISFKRGEARQTVQLTSQVGEQPSLQPPPKWRVSSYINHVIHLVSNFALMVAYY